MTGQTGPVPSQRNTLMLSSYFRKLLNLNGTEFHFDRLAAKLIVLPPKTGLPTTNSFPE